jgi:predicted glycoside hydrolase/deacetylase ChbG (UPF0249 family)
MDPNPILKKLGFSDTDRVVIIHTDDIGMCQSSLSAFADLWDYGLISSGATMVPCPWFPAVAAFCRQHPQVDLGVHVTLTCEWDTYRWGPISTRNNTSGLLDEEGYFYRLSEAVQEHGDPDAVQVEMTAQVDKALEAGINVTHADTHMGTVAHPKFIAGYIQIALQHHIQPMILRQDQAGYMAMGLDSDTAAFAAQFGLQLEENGVPLLDQMRSMPLNQPFGQLDIAKHLFSELPSGITHFILHPAADTPEIRAIAADWLSRVANYYTFLDDDLRDFIRNLGIQVIGYRSIRNIMGRTT